MHACMHIVLVCACACLHACIEFQAQLHTCAVYERWLQGGVREGEEEAEAETSAEALQARDKLHEKVNGRRSEHVTVDTIQDTSVARQQVSSVLDPGVAFEKGHSKVSQQSQGRDHDAVDGPENPPHGPAHQPGPGGCEYGTQDDSPKEALHCLVGRDADACHIRQAGFAEVFASEVGPHI